MKQREIRFYLIVIVCYCSFQFGVNARQKPWIDFNKNGVIEMEGRNRSTLDLPEDQQEFIKEIYKANPKTIVVLIAGSSLAINWIQDNIPGIINAWYPGEQGGNAIYAFGYGLSYTTFIYSNIRVDKSSMLKEDTITISIDIKNSGKYDGDEVVQLYLQQKDASVKIPLRQLKAFKRISLKKDEVRTVSFALCKKDLSNWNDKNEFVFDPGEFNLQVGSSSDDIRQEIKFNMITKVL